MKHLLLVVSLLICLFSCQNRNKRQVEKILNDWIGKEIVFPENLNFSIQGMDEIDFSISDSEYKVMVYVDSMGCTSCKLHLSEWERYINYVDSIYSNKVQFLFFFFPKKGRDIYMTLRTEKFAYPVCIDTLDVLNKLNHFSSDMRFQTFLLDKSHRVLAIGNPMQNPKIKQLYLNVISGKQDLPLYDAPSLTTALISSPQVEMGRFSWKEEQEREIRIFNTGKIPLVINEVITSCGCTTVDYTKKPVHPDEDVVLKISYKAEHPEYFDKILTVYCNAENAPFKLRVTGNAE